MKTANQKYKESKSELSFKDWLKNEQAEGKLKDHEAMFNADGEQEKDKPVTTKSAKVDLGKWNMLAVVSVVSLIYGLMKVSNSGGMETEPSMEMASE